MASPLRCPVCESRIRSADPIEPGEEVECPKCGKVFLPDQPADRPERPRGKRRAADDDAPRARRPERDRKPARAAASEDDDREKAGSERWLVVAVIAALCGGGALALVAVGALVWALTGKPDAPEAPVAVAPPPVANNPVPPAANPVPPNNPPLPPNNPAVPPNPAPTDPPRANPVPPNPQPKPNPGPAAAPKELLEKARRATALIRVEFGNKTATGSGFLIQGNADAAYLITNYHVVSLDEDDKPPPANPGPPGFPPNFPPRPPGFPARPPSFRPPGFGPPAGMFPPGLGFPGNQPAPKPKAKEKVFVVLGSGTPEEQTHPAEVVAIDPEADLATLRITGARNLPAALDLTQPAPVSETMPVFIFGFPGGVRDITVGEGKVSQLRRDENDVLSDVQINGQLNPGNSGGPVVDAQGRLVGIAVSTVRGKNVGFAIPAVRLDHMLKGSVLGGLVFQVRGGSATGELWLLDRKSKVAHRDIIQTQLNREGGGTPPNEFVVLAALNDPMHKIGAVTLRYAVADEAAVKPGPNGWAPLAGAQTVALQLRDAKATGTFKLPAGSSPDLTYGFQFSYANADGQTVYAQPHLLRLTFPKNPKSVTLVVSTPPDEPSRRYVTDTILKMFAGPGQRVSTSHTPQGIRAEIDPVDDPQTVVAKVTFGEVVKVEGRTITVAVKKVELPAPTDQELTLALNDLTSTDNRRRKAGADRLGKVYVTVPERRAEIAKALTAAAVDKDIFLRLASVAALKLWVGPENVAGLLAGLDIADGQTRSAICNLIAQYKDPAAAPALAKLLPGGFERGPASAALKAIGPAAEKAVIPFVTHKDPWTAREACAILKEIGTAASVAPLQEVIDGKPHFIVGPVATDALKSVQARQKDKPKE